MPRSLPRRCLKMISARHRVVLVLVALVVVPAALHAQAPAPAPAPVDAPPPIDHATLKRALAAKPSGDEAVKLADKVKRWFGAEAVGQGSALKIEGQEVAFA